MRYLSDSGVTATRLFMPHFFLRCSTRLPHENGPFRVAGMHDWLVYLFFTLRIPQERFRNGRKQDGEDEAREGEVNS